MKLKVIVPLLTSEYNELVKEDLTLFLAPDVSVSVVNLDHGAPSIESRYDSLCSSPDIVRCVVEAEKEDYDGVFISCVSDPAISTVREMVDIPVLGGFEPAALQATAVSKSWGIVTISESCARRIKELALINGIDRNVVRINSVNVAINELHDMFELTGIMLANIKQMIIEDRITAVVVGCTGMMGMASKLSLALQESGYSIPVIDPTAAALGYLQMMVRAGISHSRLEYPKAEIRGRTICCGV